LEAFRRGSGLAGYRLGRVVEGTFAAGGSGDRAFLTVKVLLFEIERRGSRGMATDTRKTLTLGHVVLDG